MATHDNTRIFDELDSLAAAYEVFFDYLNLDSKITDKPPVVLLDQLNKRFRSLLDQADEHGFLS